MTTIDQNEITDTKATDHRDARKSDNKYGKCRYNSNCNRYTYSRDNNYMRKDIKEEKKKYPVIKEEDKLRPDKVDTNSDSKSIYLLQSISSKEAYLTYITGNISHLNSQKELFCSTY
ncbi:unnamed protein product [Fusarium fujikuroi]|nr:unnamed protein product [Fusarium fujikuroi]